MAHLFAEAFYDDPLYQYMFPNATTRMEVLELFFKGYLDIYGKYGDIVTTSEDLTAIAYIYYQERFDNKWLYYKDLFFAMFRLIDFLKFLKIKDINRMLKIVKNLSCSSWVEDMIEGDYIHLDLLAVQRDYRGLGKAKQLIEYVINEAQVKNLPLILETQNVDNTKIYKHFNFETVEEISYEHMVKYCMLHK